jgi:hypothetical protein
MDITVNDSKEGTVATWTVESVEKMGDNTVLLGCTNGKNLKISVLLVSKIATAASSEPARR